MHSWKCLRGKVDHAITVSVGNNNCPSTSRVCICVSRILQFNILIIVNFTDQHSGLLLVERACRPVRRRRQRRADSEGGRAQVSALPTPRFTINAK